MNCVDAFACAVPDENRARYLAKAKENAAIFRQHGAEQVIECWGVETPEGRTTSFPQAVKRIEGETVVMGMVIWPSQAVRDEGMPRAMAAIREAGGGHDLFDGSRLIFGRFEAIVRA